MRKKGVSKKFISEFPVNFNGHFPQYRMNFTT
jgi:hypothetical protein